MDKYLSSSSKSGDFAQRGKFKRGFGDKSRGAFIREAIVAYTFGDLLNGVHGFSPKYIGGLDDTATRVFFNVNTEFLIQSANYGVQPNVNK